MILVSRKQIDPKDLLDAYVEIQRIRATVQGKPLLDKELVSFSKWLLDTLNGDNSVPASPASATPPGA